MRRLVTIQQQPETAKWVVFVILEDETRTVNVWKSLRAKQRTVLLHSKLLAVYGQWQLKGEVRHLVAQQLVDATRLLGRFPLLFPTACAVVRPAGLGAQRFGSRLHAG